MRRWIVSILAFVPVLLLAFGGMSALHPIADSLSVFRLPLGILTILSGAVLWPLWPQKIGFMVLALGGMAAGTILLSMVPGTLAGKVLFTHYQKNLWYNNGNVAEISQDILAKQPDFISLQEVSGKNIALFSLLAEQYPYRNHCVVDAVAVLSRHPVVAGSQICKLKQGLSAMQVITPEGPVWVVSLHLRWPYPFDQEAQVAQVVPVLSALKGPVFLGGDFNMVPWSSTLTKIEQASNSRRVGHSNGTLRLKGVFNIPIDHVLAPGGFEGTVESRPLLGSDHNGVLARITAVP